MNSSANLPAEISAQDVKQILDEASDITLLDCRRDEERKIAKLAGSSWIPIDEVEHRVSELFPHRERRLIVYCHHGIRSRMVSDWLKTNGFAAVQSMAGGIDQWSCRVDPAVPRY